MADERSWLDSPFCAHLRTKKYYFLGRPPMDASDLLDASNHCWCAKTCVLLGPDDDPAHPDDCVQGRACFQPRFGAALADPTPGAS